MLLTIKNLKKAETALVGMRVPPQQYGNVGKLVEDALEALGYVVNRGAGCDLLSIGVEVKTRTVEATSAQTVGSMLPDDVINLPYDLSPIKSKFQQQFRVHHSSISECIVSAKMYDFRKEYYQEIIRSGYEEARKIFATGIYGNYVCGKGQRCYFEKTSNGTNSYDFRMRSGLMEEFEATHDSTFEKMFNYE